MALPAPDIVQPVGTPIYAPRPLSGRTKDPAMQQLLRLFMAHRAAQRITDQFPGQGDALPAGGHMPGEPAYVAPEQPAPVTPPTAATLPPSPTPPLSGGIHWFGPGGAGVSYPEGTGSPVADGGPMRAGDFPLPTHDPRATSPFLPHFAGSPEEDPRIARGITRGLRLPGGFRPHNLNALAARRALGRI